VLRRRALCPPAGRGRGRGGRAACSWRPRSGDGRRARPRLAGGRRGGVGGRRAAHVGGRRRDRAQQAQLRERGQLRGEHARRVVVAGRPLLLLFLFFLASRLARAARSRPAPLRDRAQPVREADTAGSLAAGGMRMAPHRLQRVAGRELSDARRELTQAGQESTTSADSVACSLDTLSALLPSGKAN